VKEIEELKRQGLSISDISLMTGYSRPTVRKYLRDHQIPFYGPRAARPSKLDEYKTYIAERMRAGVWNAEVLLREIRARGYTGGYSILKDYMHPLRQAAKTTAVRRFETPPGKQAQVDWGDVGTVAMTDGSVQKLSGFVMTLGYSRAQFADVATDQTLSTLLRMHERAFTELGGVPEEILYDHMKTVVLGMDERGEIRWHPVFLDFARYWGFTPRLCRPYRPQTKGKIEAGIRYLRSSFLTGCRAVSVDDLRTQLARWVWEVANRRVHGTTHRVVWDEWESEKPALAPLRGRLPYPYVPKVTRRVSRDGYVSYGGNRYSVPWMNVGQEVEVAIQGGHLEVIRGEERLALHTLCAGVHQVITVAEHHVGIPLTAARSGGKAKVHIPAAEPVEPIGAACAIRNQPFSNTSAYVVQVRPLSIYEECAQ